MDTLHRSPIYVQQYLTTNRTNHKTPQYLFRKILTRAHIIHSTKFQENSSLRILKYFLSAKSNNSLHIELNIYKSLFKLNRTYDIQIWGSSKNVYLNKIQIT